MVAEPGGQLPASEEGGMGWAAWFILSLMSGLSSKDALI